MIKLLFRIPILYLFHIKVLKIESINSKVNTNANNSKVTYAAKQSISVIASRTRITVFITGNTLIHVFINK